MGGKTDENQPPFWYWVLAALALVWNGNGVFSCLVKLSMSPNAVHAMPGQEHMAAAAMPIWYTWVFAIASFAALAGSLGLLARKKWAEKMFLVSLAAIAVQSIHFFFLSNNAALAGTGGVTVWGFTMAIGVLLPLFAAQSRLNGWIR